MTLLLGDQLFRDLQRSPVDYRYRGRELRLSSAGPDNIQIVEADVALAFLTRYSESESGILPPGSPRNMLAPLYRTLHEALDSLHLN